MRSVLVLGFVMAAVGAAGCGTTSVELDGAVDAGPDGMDGSPGDAGLCEPVLCRIDCEHGFRRDAQGCEICECNPPPVVDCTGDEQCVLARVTTGCCSCERGYTRTQVDADPCLVERGEAPPPGCLPDPELCATIDCAACEGVVRALCDGDTCSQSSECGPGDVPFRNSCAPACTAHTDCTVAADYGSCCGGCAPTPRAYLDENPCFAERSSDTTCAPPAGACDGLGCPSPANDCVAFGDGSVCMADGSCREAATGGACPAGSHDESDVCVPD